MKMHSLKDLFMDRIKDLYSAENQIIKALPKMAKAAASAELRDAFTSHLEETRQHAQRIEQICEQLDESPKGRKCQGMAGLLEEGSEMLSIDEDSVRDAALIAAAQHVEHYEMAGYGCARTFAQMLGHDDAARILQQTLDEEAAADKKLTELAESMINEQAVAAG